jgi:histamine receptor H1
MPIGAIYIFTVDWMFGAAVCQFWISVDYTASTASILNLFILSLDRYWSVTSPLKYMRKRTKKRALIMISLVWSGSCLWLIPIIGWHHFEHGGVRTVPANVCDTEYATNTGLKIVTGTLNYYLPLAFMYGLYIKIFIEIHKRSLMEIGQRNVGYNVATEPAPASGSLSDESGGDEKSSIMKSGDNVVIANKHFDRCSLLTVSTNSRWSKCSFRNSLRDTESDVTDTEPKPAAYKLVTLNLGKNIESSDIGSSDSDARTSYTYDELMCDKTEKLHRFFYEENVVRSSHESKEETALGGNGFFEPPSSRVRFQIDHRSEASNLQHKLPKESHPNKGKYINPRTLPEVRINSERCSISDSGGGSDTKSATTSKSSRTPSKWKRKKKPRLKPSRALTKEIKAARQLGVILGAFTLCFFPYFVCFMVVAFCESCVSPDLMTAVTWVGYLNSTLNPFLYPLCNVAFRRKFRKMLNLKTPAKDMQRHSLYLTHTRSAQNSHAGLHSSFRDKS